MRHKSTRFRHLYAFSHWNHAWRVDTGPRTLSGATATKKESKYQSYQREHFVQNGHRPYLSRGYYSYYRNQPSEDKREYLTDPGSYWIVVRLCALN
jgi:hypothetical protein